MGENSACHVLRLRLAWHSSTFLEKIERVFFLVSLTIRSEGESKFTWQWLKCFTSFSALAVSNFSFPGESFKLDTLFVSFKI